MNIILELEKLKIEHYYCEDSWYSCPKAIGLYGSGSSDESKGDECNCDANKHNENVDKIINYYREYIEPILIGVK